MSTVKEVMAKIEGDAVLELQGVIEKVFEANKGTNEHGSWSFQTVMIKDAAGDNIDLKFQNRQEIGQNKRGYNIFVSAVKGKKQPWVGCVVEIYKEKLRVAVKEAADVLLYENNAWVKVGVLEKSNGEAHKPADTSGNVPAPVKPPQSGPVAPAQPGAVSTPGAVHQPTPGSVGPQKPAASNEVKHSDLTPNQQLAQLSSSQLIITKSACVKSAAEIVCALITAGKIEPVEKTISDAVKQYAGKMYNACRDVEEFLPF